MPHLVALQQIVVDCAMVIKYDKLYIINFFDYLMAFVS